MEENEKFVDGKTYIIDDEVREIAEKVIKEKHIIIGPAKIKYVIVYPNIQKTIMGRCIRSSKTLKFFSDADYIIEISGEVWDKLQDTTRKILVEHELLHILPIYNENKDKWSFKILDHDVQDFYKIINENGISWYEEMRTLAKSIYDLKPEDSERIRL